VFVFENVLKLHLGLENPGLNKVEHADICFQQFTFEFLLVGNLAVRGDFVQVVGVQIRDSLHIRLQLQRTFRTLVHNVVFNQILVQHNVVAIL